MEDKICVQTPYGKLCAVIGGDRVDYPEIFVYIEREDGVEIDLTAVSFDTHHNQLSAYLYGDTSIEDWTHKHIWAKKEIDARWEEE